MQIQVLVIMDLRIGMRMDPKMDPRMVLRVLPHGTPMGPTLLFTLQTSYASNITEDMIKNC